MLKTVSLLLAFVLISNNSNSQITKNNWLLSGSAGFSTQNNSSTASVQYKQTDIQISPTIGYFLANKLAAGVRPSYTYGKNNLVTNAKPQTILSIGPFARYYFLQTDRPFNLFAEGTYAYSFFNQSSESKQNTFSASAGPVLYFNTSVGLELTIGYSTTKVVGFKGNNNALRFGIGFQFYLEREE